MGLLASVRKSMKLRSISKRLAASPVSSLDLDDIMGSSPMAKRRADAEEELFALVAGDPTLAAILQRHGATKASLSHAFKLLSAAGCAQWVSGHWVAASALAFDCTLDFVLANTMAKPRSMSTIVAMRLIEYFDCGGPQKQKCALRSEST